jgi:hypothetical protein
MRKWLAIAGVLGFTAFQTYRFNNDTETSSLLLFEQHYSNSGNNKTEQEVQQQQQQQEESAVPFTLESFAISFDPAKVEKLQERNQHANLGTVLWVPGTDGMHQRTLDLWAQLMNRPHSPMSVEQASKLPKEHYQSPHAVGCYLAHWNLLRTLAHRPAEVLPSSQETTTTQQQACLSRFGR